MRASSREKRQQESNWLQRPLPSRGAPCARILQNEKIAFPVRNEAVRCELPLSAGVE